MLGVCKEVSITQQVNLPSSLEKEIVDLILQQHQNRKSLGVLSKRITIKKLTVSVSVLQLYHVIFCLSLADFVTVSCYFLSVWLSSIASYFLLLCVCLSVFVFVSIFVYAFFCIFFLCVSLFLSVSIFVGFLGSLYLTICLCFCQSPFLSSPSPCHLCYSWFCCC